MAGNYWSRAELSAAQQRGPESDTFSGVDPGHPVAQKAGCTAEMERLWPVSRQGYSLSCSRRPANGFRARIWTWRRYETSARACKLLAASPLALLTPR